MKFVIWQDVNKQWRWTLWSRNGRKIGASGEGYKRKAQAVRMCAKINPDIKVKVQA
jgi:uncharacterized protein YegP (UPF0339 family)